MIFPKVDSDNVELNGAYKIALADIESNIKLNSNGEKVFFAGEGYSEPWTRDASINVWNGLGLFAPDEAKNTLLAVLNKGEKRLSIGGEYWDAIIWVTGAYYYLLCSGDEAFKKTLIDVTVNALDYFEKTEFDSEKNLFRGAACYGDGVSAYPAIYTVGKKSGTSDFAKYFPQYSIERGVGNPIMTLSTNCLYYNAYRIAYVLTGDKLYTSKAERLKASINKYFWNENKGNYRYIVDPFGGSEQSEGFGLSFAILFDIADSEQTKKIIQNTFISKHGIPCLYPEYERYQNYGVARHCGTIWPQINAFWADAVHYHDENKFALEFCLLTNKVIRDGFFSEIYHPITGECYGGVQEWQGKIVEWKAERRQLWCATGYLRMIFKDILGIEITQKGMVIKPYKNSVCNNLVVQGLRYRNADIDIKVQNFKGEYFVPADAKGKVEIEF